MAEQSNHDAWVKGQFRFDYKFLTSAVLVTPLILSKLSPICQRLLWVEATPRAVGGICGLSSVLGGGDLS